MQRVPDVKEIDKKFKHFFSLSFFPKAYLFEKITNIKHEEKEHIFSFHLISRMGSTSEQLQPEIRHFKRWRSSAIIRSSIDQLGIVYIRGNKTLDIHNFSSKLNFIGYL